MAKRLNEHTNGLIRQYLPKKTDFTTVSYSKIKMIQNRLNNRPRKTLDYKTPKEALDESSSGIIMIDDKYYLNYIAFIYFIYNICYSFKNQE